MSTIVQQLRRGKKEQAQKTSYLPPDSICGLQESSILV
jgi:hypothetical protein